MISCSVSRSITLGSFVAAQGSVGSGQGVTSARQRGENPLGSFGHAHFGQHVDVVPQSRIDGDQAIVFGNRLGEIMPSFLVQRVDFRPWRRKEYAFVVAIDPAEALDNRLSRQLLKPGGSINQASVEKDPARERVSVGPIGE